MNKVIIVGSGNAALCAAISALEHGSEVLILEAADEKEAGGNSKYTAGAMRFVYDSGEELLHLLNDPNDQRLEVTDFGSYPKEKFENDLLGFNDGRPLSPQQKILISNSKETIQWLADHNIKFDPIYSRQSFQKDGKYIFWGGLTLEAKGEGVGLVDAQLKRVIELGGTIEYNHKVTKLQSENNTINGVVCEIDGNEVFFKANAVVLGCGGFESSKKLRAKYMGDQWADSMVRGTRHNLGAGIEMALEVGAAFEGNPEGCHATPMDMYMPENGNLDIPFIERKQYRKICYFLGIMVNADGNRFVDEGINFRNYTYAQFGKAILKQPKGFAYQVFDKKVEHLLYSEYFFWDAHFIESNTLEGLVDQMQNVDKNQMLKTINEYNLAVDKTVDFDPTILDGKSTKGLELNKTNWANALDTPPFKAYPVRCGITFTYGGLKVNDQAAVINMDGNEIKGLFACGELVGGVFYNGYPGGSGLTSGAVFGKIAGQSAASKFNDEQ